LPLTEEEAFLRDWLQRAAHGEVLTAKQLRAQLEKVAGRKVTLGYVYGLLHRHGWRKLGPRPRHPKAQMKAQERFKKNSPKSSKRS
jgi:transposase